MCCIHIVTQNTLSLCWIPLNHTHLYIVTLTVTVIAKALKEKRRVEWEGGGVQGELDMTSNTMTFV